MSMSGRWLPFVRICLLLAATAMFAMPVAHNLAMAAAPAGEDAGHHGAHAAHGHDATGEVDAPPEGHHEFMQCDCLLCKLLKTPVLLSELPWLAAPEKEHGGYRVGSQAVTIVADPYRRPPSRAPPFSLA